MRGEIYEDEDGITWRLAARNGRPMALAPVYYDDERKAAVAFDKCFPNGPWPLRMLDGSTREGGFAPPTSAPTAAPTAADGEPAPLGPLESPINHTGRRKNR
jgi:hypothetical protein